MKRFTHMRQKTKNVTHGYVFSAPADASLEISLTVHLRFCLFLYKARSFPRKWRNTHLVDTVVGEVHGGLIDVVFGRGLVSFRADSDLR